MSCLVHRLARLIDRRESICQPSQAEIAPLSAWKIHERIANASEIRMPTAPGSHIAENSMTNSTGPAISEAEARRWRHVRILADQHLAKLPRAEQDHARAGDHRRQVAERHQDEAQQQAEERIHHQSVIAIARSAMRSRAESFSVALLSWPQAARMSRPRGVRTGDE